jgi:hypothetical protein
MNQKQQPQSQDDLIEVRDLTSDEVLATAGGPQITNDAPGLIASDDLSAIAGGPQVTNDGIALVSPEDVGAVAGGPQITNDWP